MKSLFPLFLLILAGALFTFSACCDDDDGDVRPCSEEGVIVGIDLRECACCGGFFIEVGEDTIRAETLPGPFGQDFDPQTEIPLPIYLEWHDKDPQCLGDEVVLDCIARR